MRTALADIIHLIRFPTMMAKKFTDTVFPLRSHDQRNPRAIQVHVEQEGAGKKDIFGREEKAGVSSNDIHLDFNQ